MDGETGHLMDSQPLTAFLVSKLDTESCISKKGKGIIFRAGAFAIQMGFR